MSDANIAQLLARVPDSPRWVELRSALLSDQATIFGPIENCAVACADDLIFLVGRPEVLWIRDAAALHPGAEIGVNPETLAHVQGWARKPATVVTVHVLPEGRALPIKHKTRILTDDEGLQHIPDALRAELHLALEEGPIAAAIDLSQPVSFCYAGSTTETFWDISIDTLEGHRRFGYAGSAVGAMVRHLMPTGRRPVWCSEANNPASGQLAAKLGFKPVDTFHLFPAGAFLGG